MDTHSQKRDNNNKITPLDDDKHTPIELESPLFTPQCTEYYKNYNFYNKFNEPINPNDLDKNTAIKIIKKPGTKSRGNTPEKYSSF